MKVRKARNGGGDRVSTKAKLANELMLLGEVVVAARTRSGLRQSHVAERGLPASYLSKIEKGTRRLDVIELVRIAEAIGGDPAEMVRDLQKRLEKGSGDVDTDAIHLAPGDDDDR